MLPRQITLALFVAFIVPAVLLVSLQEDNTNRIVPQIDVLAGYYEGTGPQEVVGTDGVPIVKARCLVRGWLALCERIAGEDLPLYNTAIQFASVWAALCVIYLTAVRLMPPAAAAAAALLAVVFVPWGYLSVGNWVSWPYDLPALFFAALGLWALVSRRFAVLAVVVVLGTLNKETTLFLVPAYVLAEWRRLPGKTLILRASILAALFLLAYETPRMILSGHGQPVATFSALEWEVPRWKINLQHLVLKQHGTPFENVYWVFSLHLLPLLRFSALPPVLRATYFALPALLVPIFLVGNIYELRLYNELIPLGAMATIFVAARKLEIAPAPQPTAP